MQCLKLLNVVRDLTELLCIEGQNWPFANMLVQNALSSPPSYIYCDDQKTRSCSADILLIVRPCFETERDGITVMPWLLSLAHSSFLSRDCSSRSLQLR
jgi:hypothetical protein